MTVGVGERYFKEVKMDKQIKMSASEVDLYIVYLSLEPIKS